MLAASSSVVTVGVRWILFHRDGLCMGWNMLAASGPVVKWILALRDHGLCLVWNSLAASGPVVKWILVLLGHEPRQKPAATLTQVSTFRLKRVFFFDVVFA